MAPPSTPPTPNGRAPDHQPRPDGSSRSGRAAPRTVRKPHATRKEERRAAASTSRPAGRAARRKPPRRGRRVHRVIRRIDLWSVLKLALVLYTCIYAAVLMATAGLWAFVNSSGLVDKFESFMKDVGFNNWQFHGPQMFKGVAAGGAILVLTFSVLSLVVVGLVNVVSELTGGIRITVIEEEPSSGYRRRVNPTLAEWEASQQASRGAPATGPPPGERAGAPTGAPATVRTSPGL